MRTIGPFTATFGGAATADLSQASQTSDPIPLDSMLYASYQLAVTGAASLNGAVKLQCSNDLGYNPFTGLQNISGITNWTDVAGATVTITANGASNLNGSGAAGYRWARLVYTRTGGAGTMAVLVNEKSEQ